MIDSRHTSCSSGRQFFCLLFVVLILVGWVVPAFGEEGAPVINASGNENIRLAVDPIRHSEGYSAILYDNRSGLPTSEANAISQTSEGFIWIGSYAGLIRYDGNTFKRIDSNTGIANVRCLYADSQDRLWIGTNDSGVFLMIREEIQKLDQTVETGFVSTRAIAQGEGDTIYVASSAGLGFFDADLNFQLLQDERILGKTVRDIRYGSDGLLYGLTLDGDLFTVNGDALVTYLSHDECRVEGVLSLLPDPKQPGYVYVGTQDSRVLHGSLTKNFSSMGVKDISPLSSVERFESIDGEIWFCAVNGIGKLDATGFHRLKNTPLDSSVEHVMTDYEGNLWFTSSKQGIMKIVPNQFNDLFNKLDLPAVVVNSTCLDGNRLFIGTDAGLIVVEDNGTTADAIPLTKCATASGVDLGATDLLEYLNGVRIRSVIRDSVGRLWISTWYSTGLICCDHGEVTVYTEQDGLFSNRVRTVEECEDGTIVATSTGGVSIIRDGRVVDSHGEEDGIVNDEILTIAEGYDHELILGSDGGGIYVIGPDGTKHIGMDDGLKSEVILRVKRSRDHSFYWIVTSNSLAYMTPDYQVTTIDHFPYSNNYDLYENSQGGAWVLSSNGVYVVSVEELLANDAIGVVFHGIASGMPYMPTSNSYSELTPEGDLYIAGVGGTIKVSIEKTFVHVDKMKVAMPYIDIDGRRTYPDASGGFTVPRDARKVTIYPYVLTYALIDPQISYQLEGFDQAEIAVSRDELGPLNYTNLREGTYDFVIRVDDPDGDAGVTASYRIVKEKTLPDVAAACIIMDITSLFFLCGILIYTSMYLKRGRFDDKLFFGLILTNAVLAVAELCSYLLEGSSISVLRELMVAENTIFYAALELFPYLFLLYLDYRAYQDRARVRRLKLLYGIPFLLVILLLIVNLKTGWIFSITKKNVYRSGSIDQVLFVPILFYFATALTRAHRINPRLVFLGILLLLSCVAFEFLHTGISSITFIYTLFLVCTHIHVMNRSVIGEEAP